MRIKQFEDLISWQKAQDLAVDIYKEFAEAKDYGFKNQICRAAVSISNNIAEGFDRNTDKEFARFLYISSASSSEVKSMLYLAQRLHYLEKDKATELRVKANEINKINRGLINSLLKE